MTEEIRFKQDIHRECRKLMERLGEKAKETRALGISVPHLRTRMCYDLCKIVEQTLDVFVLLELTE